MTVHKDEVRTAQWSMVQNGQRAWVMGEGVAIRTTASSRGTTSSPPVAFSRRSVAIFLSFGERNIHAAHSTALCWCIFAQALWLHSAGPGAAHVAASRWPRHDRDLLAQWFCQLWLLIHAVECVSARELHGWSRTHHHSCNKRHIDRNRNCEETIDREHAAAEWCRLPTVDVRWPSFSGPWPRLYRPQPRRRCYLEGAPAEPASFTGAFGQIRWALWRLADHGHDRSLDRNTLAIPLKEDNAALQHGQSMDGVCSRDGGRRCGAHGEAVKDAFAGESRTHAVATLGLGGLLA
jgi:hypothetical protein